MSRIYIDLSLKYDPEASEILFDMFFPVKEPKRVNMNYIQPFCLIAVGMNVYVKAVRNLCAGN